MATLLIRLVGPMQSWGIASRFYNRDTGKEPSKSGVLGMLCAAMGIDRSDWAGLKPLCSLVMGVRHDRSGVLKRDFQTAGQGVDEDGLGRIVRANAKTRTDEGVVSHRFYLADAAFLVGLESQDSEALEGVHSSLNNPVWPLCLGRKSYLPSEPVYLPDGLVEKTMPDALRDYPWLGRGAPPSALRYTFETGNQTGRMVMDQPTSSFAQRRFGARFVETELIEYGREVINAA